MTITVWTAKGPHIDWTNGDRTSQVNATGWNSSRCDVPQARDFACFQVVLTSAHSYGSFVGIAASMTLDNFAGSNGNGAGVEFAPPSLSTTAFKSGSFQSVSLSGPCAVGDRISVVVRRDLGKAWIAMNGAFYLNGNPEIGANPWCTFPPNTDVYPVVSHYMANEAATLCADADNIVGMPAGCVAWSDGVAPPPPPPPPTAFDDYSVFPVGATVGRERVLAGTKVLYVDPVNGSDVNDGSTQALAFKTPQAAVNHAQDRYDCVSNPLTWFNKGNTVYRPGVIVELMPCSMGSCLLPQPLSVMGYTPAGMIVLRGGPNPSLTNAAQYNLQVTNTFQGITAQNGGLLLCDGFTIKGGAAGTTLINTLEQGKIAVRNIVAGGLGTRMIGAFGVPQLAMLDVIGKVSLVGPGFAAVFCGIEGGMFNFAQGADVRVEETMNFGDMINLMHAQAWTQGVPIVWSGAGIVSSTGNFYNLNNASFMSFKTFSAMPGGRGGVCDATSSFT